MFHHSNTSKFNDLEFLLDALSHVDCASFSKDHDVEYILSKMKISEIQLNEHEVAFLFNHLGRLQFYWLPKEFAYYLVSLLIKYLPESPPHHFIGILLSLKLSQVDIDRIDHFCSTISFVRLILRRFDDLASQMTLAELSEAFDLLSKCRFFSNSADRKLKEDCIRSFSNGLVVINAKKNKINDHVSMYQILATLSKSTIPIQNLDINAAQQLYYFIDILVNRLEKNDIKFIFDALRSIEIDFSILAKKIQRKLLLKLSAWILNASIDDKIHLCATFIIIKIPRDILDKYKIDNENMLQDIKKHLVENKNHGLNNAALMQIHQLFLYYDIYQTLSEDVKQIFKNKANNLKKYTSCESRAEKCFAASLKKYLIGTHIRFEKGYIIADFKPVDFYFPDHKIIIELDGTFHYTNQGNLRAKDQFNQTILEKLGNKVIRFKTNINHRNDKEFAKSMECLNLLPKPELNFFQKPKLLSNPSPNEPVLSSKNKTFN